MPTWSPCDDHRTFRLYEADDRWLWPPSPQEWLPADHLASFVSDLVEELDLRLILRTDGGVTRDTAPYHSRLLVKVLLDAYAVGGGRIAPDGPETGRGCGVSRAGGEPAAGFSAPQ